MSDTSVEHSTENSSSASDAVLALKNVPQEAESTPKAKCKLRLNMIFVFARDVFLYCLLFMITAYATYQKVPLKVSQAPQPTKFIPNASFVSDWPSGKLGSVQNKVALTEVSLVLYYAPWCAESQRARHVYASVSELFHKDVHFAAINCWQPNGECRKQYSKVPSWPTLMAYKSTGMGIQYNGQWTRSALIRFIRSLLYPVKRLTDLEGLLRLITVHDAVVLAFLDMETHRMEYKLFHQTAVKFLEGDPYRDVVFAICTGTTKSSFGIDEIPRLRLYLWNETLEYPTNKSWSQIEIFRWVSLSIQQVTEWLSAGEGKSFALHAHLSQGPVLVFFAQRNYLLESPSVYTLVKQISMEYFNCLNSTWARRITTDSMQNFANDYQMQVKELRKRCMNENLKLRPIPDPPLESSAEEETCPSDENRSTCASQNSIFGSLRAEEEEAVCHETQCSDAASVLERSKKAPIKAPYNESMDKKAPKNLIHRIEEEECKLWRMMETESTQSTIEIGAEQLLDSITGLACKTNRSMTMILMDTTRYLALPHRLGIQSDAKGVSAVLIDPELEMQYVLEHQEVSAESIANVLRQFTNGTLESYRRSRSSPVPVKLNNPNRNVKVFGIEELNSTLFEERVLHSNTTAVVLFYSSQCLLCSIMSSYLLTVARALEPIQRLEFFRIDGDKNDLSFQHNQDTFPTLVIFPAGRKNESRLFSPTHKVTQSNLFNFILSNLEAPDKLYGIFLLCKHFRRNASGQQCLQVLANEAIYRLLKSQKHRRQHGYEQYRWRNRRVNLTLARIYLLSADFQNLAIIEGEIHRYLRYSS